MHWLTSSKTAFAGRPGVEEPLRIRLPDMTPLVANYFQRVTKRNITFLKKKETS